MRINHEYNLKVLKRIEKLLLLEKKEYKIDLHIHTNCSADGIQTVEEAIDKTIEHEFDIISIADHDSIEAYTEVLEIEKEKVNCPIIIPGIEFTVDFPEYEGRCHILKYFYNMDDDEFIQNISKNKLAYLKRVDLWFERIQKNDILNYYSQKYHICYSKMDYLQFLAKTRKNIPEYATIMEYLFSLLQKNGVNIWDVYDKVNELNELDGCTERKNIMSKELERFWGKYKDKEIANNYRKLRPLLAPVNIDDDNFKCTPGRGSLSVGKFGQVNIRELSNIGINVFAHPSCEKIGCIDLVSDIIQGIELNYRSTDRENQEAYLTSKRLKKVITKGSDKHDNNDDDYLNDFYSISKIELMELYIKMKKIEIDEMMKGC